MHLPAVDSPRSYYNTSLQVSASSKDLIRKMLVVDPEARIGMSGVLSHPWITVHAAKSVMHMDRAVGRLKQFNLKRKVKIAAMAAAFGTRHLASARDLDELVGGRQFSKEELGALAAAFSRVAGVSTTAVNLEQFRRVLSLTGVTASLPADRLFVLFDTGEWDSVRGRGGSGRWLSSAIQSSWPPVQMATKRLTHVNF